MDEDIKISRMSCGNKKTENGKRKVDDLILIQTF